MSVRVRFAPSPTGLLHVGALRTVVFNDLFAKRHQGTLILRIEDTDRTRYNPESEAEFIETLKWVGIEFHEGPHVGGDFGPYRQSERKEAGIYTPFVEELLAKGAAYEAFETPEELEQMREFQRINKMPTGYFGGDWRDATPEQVAAAKAEGKPCVIRLKIPRNTTIVGEDVVRGKLEWDSNTVDDPVIIKADGMPTYHFAAMVDDHLMQITHVFRGEEWISSYPKHIALFDAFGWDKPVFVHCPVIVGNDGKKLSKRHGATRVLDYKYDGFLPDALKNFVALIGWNPGDDREIMAPEELAGAFHLEGIQASPGKFDMEKLKWMNGVGIRSLDRDSLISTVSELVQDPEILPYYAGKEPEDPAPKISADEYHRAISTLASALDNDSAFAEQCVILEQERVQTLADFGPATEFFLVEELSYDEKAVEKWFGEPHVRKLLDDLAGFVSGKSEVSVEECEGFVKGWAAENGFDKIGPVVHPTRVALSGKTSGPGLFDLMSCLGPDRMAKRIARAKELLR